MEWLICILSENTFDGVRIKNIFESIVYNVSIVKEVWQNIIKIVLK